MSPLLPLTKKQWLSVDVGQRCRETLVTRCNKTGARVYQVVAPRPCHPEGGQDRGKKICDEQQEKALHDLALSRALRPLRRLYTSRAGPMVDPKKQNEAWDTTAALPPRTLAACQVFSRAQGTMFRMIVCEIVHLDRRSRGQKKTISDHYSNYGRNFPEAKHGWISSLLEDYSAKG